LIRGDKIPRFPYFSKFALLACALIFVQETVHLISRNDGSILISQRYKLHPSTAPTRSPETKNMHTTIKEKKKEEKDPPR
jgi:hypothetical protein